MQRDGVWYFHKFVKGERLFNGRKTPFSLETRDEAVAVAKRDAILATASGAEIDRVTGRKTEEAEASLTAIIEAYDKADYPSRDARTQNIAALKRVVRQALGERADLGRLTSADLTAGTKQAFQDFIVARARGEGHEDDSDEMLQAKFSANRTFAKASSVWANEKCFRGLRVTRPTGFLAADDFVVKRDMSFRPMSPAEVMLFDDECRHADGPDAGVRLTFLLMRWLGMRNEEVEHCKPTEWISMGPHGDWLMHITNRPYFRVKGTGSIRQLPVSMPLLARILSLVPGARIDGGRIVGGREWLIPREAMWSRFDVTHRDINDWMKDVHARGVTEGRLSPLAEARTAYDFRKQAGSEHYQKFKDILETSKWLGHRDVQTTTRWYVNLIGGLRSLA